jgi:hypothetical protein
MDIQGGSAPSNSASLDFFDTVKGKMFWLFRCSVYIAREVLARSKAMCLEDFEDTVMMVHRRTTTDY